MNWKDVGAKIAKSAPVLGSLLGGPAGGALGGVVSLVASALGLETDEVTPDLVDNIITTDPQAMIKLKEIESKHKERLEELAIESDRAHLADVANARTREVEITRATGSRDINLYVLAWIVVGCFFLLVGVLMGVTLPEANIGPINQLFGAMATGFGMVLQYFFGSSKGSADKNNIMKIARQ